MIINILCDVCTVCLFPIKRTLGLYGLNGPQVFIYFAAILLESLKMVNDAKKNLLDSSKFINII